MFSKKYSLTKSRRVLKLGIQNYKKKAYRLSEADRQVLRHDLEKLDLALVVKDRNESDLYAKKVELFVKKHFPKTLFEHGRELTYALAFAVVFAFLIRQFWFELYEVPTGSMRPTIEELDRLVVSKTTFGINLPFQNKLQLFKPDYVQRGSAIVFTVEDMDVPDADTRYFYLFPGKKRFVKRCMGKMGDTLYFYGGLVYGLDKEGREIQELHDLAFLKSIGIERIDHIPFINFEGKVSLSESLGRGLYGKTLIQQMDLPIGKIEGRGNGSFSGQFFDGKEWRQDTPSALKKAHDKPVSYSDLWGIGNYAFARLLTTEQLTSFYGTTFAKSKESVLYLELRHTPNLTYPKPEIRRGETGKAAPSITPFVAVIPLSQTHLHTMQSALYTARFFVRNGHAYRYQEGRSRPQPPQFDPLFTKVPNGLYEFYYGKGYKVLWGGIRTSLPPNHPLYDSSPENIQRLFNMGMNMNIIFQPMSANQPFNPQRFAYFRNGDLYVMGAKLLDRGDPVLKEFVEQELTKQENSSDTEPYIAFIDHGPPSVDKIQAFGLKLPDDGVLALGDNYAMSSDSRDFGFVPVDNLRGAPSFTFWPPSKRIGPLPQVPYAWLTLPNVLIWALVALCFVCWSVYLNKRNKRRKFKP